ncbi:hypothetical protein HDV06_001779 [Boothiomyces sp. JEL0866]|nr:hypothetical protein HDV06_001779 [Boothiomyces sp. JEL0866]
MLKSNKLDKKDLRNSLNKVQKGRKQQRKPNGNLTSTDLRNTIITRNSEGNSSILREIERRIEQQRKQITITIDNKPSSTMSALLEKGGLYADKPRLVASDNDAVMEISIPNSPVTMKNKAKFNPNRMVVELSNISPDITKEDLQRALREFGAMERLIVRTTDGKFSGTALVTYKHKHSGFALIEKFHNKLVDGRILRAIHIPEETLSSRSLYSDAPVNQPRLSLRDVVSK